MLNALNHVLELLPEKESGQWTSVGQQRIRHQLGPRSGAAHGPVGLGRAPTMYLSSDQRRNLGSGLLSANGGSGIGLDHVPELPPDRSVLEGPEPRT